MDGVFWVRLLIGAIITVAILGGVIMLIRALGLDDARKAEEERNE